jgi:hypothetical protein
MTENTVRHTDAIAEYAKSRKFWSKPFREKWDEIRPHSVWIGSTESLATVIVRDASGERRYGAGNRYCVPAIAGISTAFHDTVTAAISKNPWVDLKVVARVWVRNDIAAGALLAATQEYMKTVSEPLMRGFFDIGPDYVIYDFEHDLLRVAEENFIQAWTDHGKIADVMAHVARDRNRQMASFR